MNEVEAVALKPCPFCGSPAELDTRQAFRSIFDGKMLSQVSVYCTSCSANISNYPGDLSMCREATTEICVEEWNTRAALDAARGDAEPDCAVDAWLAECTDGRVSDHTIKMLKTFSMWAHAHPPRGDQVARVVEWLRNGGGTDISQLNGSMQMLFLEGMNRYADAIERGEPFNG